MPDLNDYTLKLQQEESQLLARRKTVLGQKLLVDRVFTTEAARRRKELEKELTTIENRISQIRSILGQRFSEN
ncbi:MAG: hypothetical protein P3T54_06985 [Dehalogenimonas sp.]|jgi:hypothetical protein|uniref:50S ribosomal protein L29 n=1 Tax=Candidatus Dehalogenimonas loeffleri TaxID=3127115 RepID=A0ABZ2J7V0_9CHLR|nr:hypothetical protein [Dehalogenimonas sp.]